MSAAYFAPGVALTAATTTGGYFVPGVGEMNFTAGQARPSTSFWSDEEGAPANTGPDVGNVEAAHPDLGVAHQIEAGGRVGGAVFVDLAGHDQPPHA